MEIPKDVYVPQSFGAGLGRAWAGNGTHCGLNADGVLVKFILSISMPQSERDWWNQS